MLLHLIKIWKFFGQAIQIDQLWDTKRKIRIANFEFLIDLSYLIHKGFLVEILIIEEINQGKAIELAWLVNRMSDWFLIILDDLGLSWFFSLNLCFVYFGIFDNPVHNLLFVSDTKIFSR